MILFGRLKSTDLILIFFAACECNEKGSKTKICNNDGKCSCKDYIFGDKCDACKAGFFGFPDCKGNYTSLSLALLNYL